MSRPRNTIPGGDPDALPGRPRSAVSRRRRATGAVVGGVGLVGLTATLSAAEPSLELSSVLLLYLAVTVVATAVGGAAVAVATGTVSVALAVYFFTSPQRTFVIHDLEVVTAVAVFALVTALVSWLVDRAAARARDATRAGAEASALARLISTLAEADDPAPALVRDLVATFGLSGAALLRHADPGWALEAAAGAQVPQTPEHADDVLGLGEGRVLALAGRRLPSDDRRVLASYAAQLAVAAHARRLQEHAAAATVEAETNRLRAALLSSVSHDLRTPLASIKAYASSLLQPDVRWRRADIDEFARSIVGESDRLNTLITNLLDMSRLAVDSVAFTRQAVGLDEILPTVLGTLAFRQAKVHVDLPDDLPPVDADPVLLERVVTNLLENALRWSPEGTPVVVRGSTDGAGWVHLDVVDRGPGIAREARERLFQPFQRSGEGTSGGPGVGLGLAVAHGFVAAMGGELELLDTPGRGATARIALRTSPVVATRADAPRW